MTDATNGTSNDDSIVYKAFIPLLVLLVILVVYGYYIALAKIFQELGTGAFAPFLAAPVALVVVPILLLHFVRHAAHSWRAFQLREVRRKYTGIWRPAAIFLLCFLFSGYGVLSSAIRLIEGPAIIRASLTGVNDSFAALSGDAENILATTSWDTLQAAVDSDKTQLTKEIINPNGGENCGVKTHAQSIVADVAEKLPNFRTPSGVDVWDHNCADVDEMERISSVYNAAIDDALQNAPLYASENVATKQALRADVSEQITLQQHVLANDLSALDAARTFFFHPQYLLEFENDLDNAGVVYADVYQKLKAVAPAANFRSPSPESLRTQYIDVIDNLVSPLQIATAMPWLAKFFLTWVFLIAAVALDLLTCFAAYSVIRRYYLLTERTFVVMPKDKRLGDVDYIWTSTMPVRDGLN